MSSPNQTFLEKMFPRNSKQKSLRHWADSLRPTVNRPTHKEAKAASRRLTIGRRLSAQCHLHCDTKCGRTGASPSMTLEVCSIRTGRETRLVWGCFGENRKRWAFFIQGAAKRSGIGFECGD